MCYQQNIRAEWANFRTYSKVRTNMYINIVQPDLNLKYTLKHDQIFFI